MVSFHLNYCGAAIYFFFLPQNVVIKLNFLSHLDIPVL